MSAPIRPQEPHHPTGRPLSDFERRFLRLRLIGHEAHLLHCGLTRTEDRKQDDDLVLTLQNYAHILISRFLEIWADFQSMAKDNRRVREIAAAVSPLIDRINTWPGLRDYRNWVLAHRYRINNEPEFIPPWAVLDTQRVPSKPAEVLVLLECVRFAVAGTMVYFSDIYEPLRPVLDPGPERPPPHGAVSGSDAEAERRRLAIDMDERLKALGVDIQSPILLEFNCDPAAGA